MSESELSWCIFEELKTYYGTTDRQKAEKQREKCSFLNNGFNSTSLLNLSIQVQILKWNQIKLTPRAQRRCLAAVQLVH